MEPDVKLTKLASCAGCGAKVGAGTLVKMLDGFRTHTDPRLIVGYDKSDDASVYVVSDDTAIVQTTDFFPPIVDDPFSVRSDRRNERAERCVRDGRRAEAGAQYYVPGGLDGRQNRA